MIIFREKPRLLYLHGKDEEINYPDGGIIYKTLKKYFNIDFADISSNPEKGLKDFKKLKLNNYDFLIGFSMGGVYSTLQNIIPSILINPGFGLSQIWSEFTELENGIKSNSDVKLILVGTDDKYKIGYIPEIEKFGWENKMTMFPSKHVPTEDQIIKYIIPEIKQIIK